MSDITPAVSASTAPLVARMTGVIFSPRATYAGVVARPRALGALACVLFISISGMFTFLSTRVGQQAILDQQVRTMESFGMNIGNEAYERMEQGADRVKYVGAAGQLVTLPLMALVVAGIAFAVFTAALGGDGTFFQVFAIVSHSGIVIALAQVVALPLAYARETLSGVTNLGVFAPFLDENTFPARVLGSVDLVILWWAVSLAIGLGVLYKRRTGPIAATLIVLYVALGVVVAAVKSAVAGA